MQLLYNACSVLHDVICTYSSYIEQLVVLVLDGLKRVFFRSSLAHFEETRASVGGERQLLQHDVLRHTHFLPKIHFYI